MPAAVEEAGREDAGASRSRSPPGSAAGSESESSNRSRSRSSPIATSVERPLAAVARARVDTSARRESSIGIFEVATTKRVSRDDSSDQDPDPATYRHAPHAARTSHRPPPDDGLHDHVRERSPRSRRAGIARPGARAPRRAPSRPPSGLPPSVGRSRWRSAPPADARARSRRPSPRRRPPPRFLPSPRYRRRRRCVPHRPEALPPSRSRPTGPALIHSRIPTPPRLTPSPTPPISFSDYQVASNGPLESARLFIALATVALILFQGPKGDGVVNSLNENRVFGSGGEAKSAVDYVTAGLIGGFIVLSAVLAAQN